MDNFDLSYSLGSPPQTSAGNENLWSFNQCPLYPSTNGIVLAQPRRGGQAMLLQREVADALTYCRRFRTLDEHFQEMAANMPGLIDHREETLETLTTLAEGGCLESGTSAWQRLTGYEAPGEPAPCGICILTCDRPEGLERLLSQLCAMALPRTIDRIWVIDDSRHTNSMDRNAEIIARHTNACCVDLTHVDQRLRRGLIAHLQSKAPEAKETIGWLLSRENWGQSATYGQARNLALLLNVGKRLLMLDDDIILEAVKPPLSPAGVQLSADDRREFSFFTSKASLASRALYLPESPLDLMLSSLGAPAGQILNSAPGGAASLRGRDGELIASYSGNSRVAISQCGYWGDSGTGDTGTWLFNLPETCVNRMLGESDDLEALMGARATWAGTRGPILSRYASMSALTGVDHSTLLPPYFPVGRGEDLFFGILTMRLHPSSLVLNEGWAVRHEPIEERTGNIPLAPLKVGVGLPLLMDWMGREPRDFGDLSAESELRRLSEQLWTLSEMRETSIEKLVVQELASKRALVLETSIKHMERFVSQENMPGFPQWQRFIEASRDNLLAEISDTNPSRPLTNWLESQAFDIERLRTEARCFSRALKHWPAICDACKDFTT